MSVLHWTSGILLSLVVCASCRMPAVTRTEPRPPIVQPGAPGESSRVITADRAVDLSQVQFTDADVRFMQAMIGHHAQAVEMTSLVAARTSNRDIQMLARRIAVSQQDEIQLMARWLQTRGQKVPETHAHHEPGATLTAGMLTEEEMMRLAQESGAQFDRLFLEGMIKHHEGALKMVEELFSKPGAGQDSEIFGFASDVDADQRTEIARMSAMLEELQK